MPSIVRIIYRNRATAIYMETNRANGSRSSVPNLISPPLPHSHGELGFAAAVPLRRRGRLGRRSPPPRRPFHLGCWSSSPPPRSRRHWSPATGALQTAAAALDSGSDLATRSRLTRRHRSPARFPLLLAPALLRRRPSPESRIWPPPAIAGFRRASLADVSAGLLVRV